ncbi:MAG: ComF family protein [Gammaproteobacteria bacterium]|nr:ComF family protein [Gammaproteobacteria bacterium]
MSESTAGDEKIICGQCLQQPPHFDCLLSPFRYENPVDWLVQRLKYNASLSHVPVLAGLLLDYLQPLIPERPETIVPVPLHVNRLRARGFNQALELARPLARHFSIPIGGELCLRHIDTPQQSALPARQRAKNLRNAFMINQKPTVNSVAIIDDVVTTGATVDALAKLLKRNGVERVQVWSVARTVVAGKR